MKDQEPSSVKHMPVWKVNGESSLPLSDIVSVEEPLEIRLGFGSAAKREVRTISITMRTPGHDFELATGFLFTEGIITAWRDVKKIYYVSGNDSSEAQNIVQVDLHDHVIPQLANSDRNFYTTSSCGVCGKSSIHSIRAVSPFQDAVRPAFRLTREVVYQLPAKLKTAQSGFAATGGIHASGLFSVDGALQLLKEDVGRHNALDKLIGYALQHDFLPLNRHVILLSGRVSFELIQKAAMAGATLVAAIGAPSSLAVELARECDITLLGFVKDDRFNIYHASERMVMPAMYENHN